MKNYLVLVLLTLLGCQTQKINPDNLPKDIALKPNNNISQAEDTEVLRQKIKAIEQQIAAISCTDSSMWTFSPIGAKACGGPSSYIAYPKIATKDILPKIEEFTALQDAYNKKYHIMSNCMMVMPPSDIICENGKAVLISSSASQEAQ